ncbi:MAG: PAS domain-containing protein, partial [Gemmatimonadetes bacterium]|nr:PAS domain-containing protein [Gemmatimonadota bacterium]
MLRADGTPGWSVSRAVPVLGDAGEIVEWVGAASDVTARKEAEAAAARAEHRAERVIERMGDAHCVLDRDFTFVAVNAAAERLLGVSRETLVGRSHWEVFPASVDAPVGRAFRRVVAEGIEQHLVHHYTGEGYDLHLELDAYPTDEGGVAMFWRDVTERARAEQALRASEEKYRALFSEMDEAYAVVEVMAGAGGLWTDFLFLEVNAAFMRHTGMPYPVGQTATQLLGTPNPRWAELYGRAAETGESIRVEERELTLGRVFDLNIFRLGGAGSRRVAVLFTDITERKRAEAALRESEAHLATELEDASVLQKISNELVSEAGPDGHYNHIVEVARTLMRADAASIQELDAADSRLKLLAHAGFHAESAAFWSSVDAGAGSSCGRALMAHERVVVPDMDEFEADPHDVAAYRKSGIMSVQSTPLVASSGRIVGMLSTHWNHPHAPGADGYRFFDILARLAADFMERARGEAALRESEEKYRTLFEWMGQGYSLNEVVRDAEGAATDLRYLELNPAFERLTGASVSEARGRLASEVFPGLDRYWVDICDRAARTGVLERVEHELTPNGRWYESNFYPIGRDRVLSLYDDITDRKRAEIALRRSEERQAFLLKLSDALRAATSADAAETLAVELTAAQLKVDRCYVGVLVPDQDRSVVAHEYRRPDLPSMKGEYRYSDFPESARRIEAGRLALDDIQSNASLGDDDKASFAGLRIGAQLAVYLRKGDGRVTWSLTAADESPRRWTSDDGALLDEVAERTWAVLERIRAEEALRESEEKYRSLFDTMAEGFTVCRVIRDDGGRVVDLGYLQLNQALERQTGLDRRATIGRRFSELFTQGDLDRLLPLYARVADTGEPV